MADMELEIKPLQDAEVEVQAIPTYGLVKVYIYHTWKPLLLITTSYILSRML